MANTDSVSSLAQQAAQQLGWNPTFIANQWALETGNFTSNVWKTDNNPAGIKWYPGMTYGTKGSPASDGGYYASFSNPVTGYVNFVKNNPRYSNVGNSQDPYTEAQTIAKDGWATDPNYASKVMGVTVNGNQTVNTTPNSSIPGMQQTAFGIPSMSDIQNIVTNALGVIVGALLIGLGIWVAMNPFSDLTTAIISTVGKLSKMPLEGATNQVKNLPNNVRNQKKTKNSGKNINNEQKNKKEKQINDELSRRKKFREFEKKAVDRT